MDKVLRHYLSGYLGSPDLFLDSVYHTGAGPLNLFVKPQVWLQTIKEINIYSRQVYRHYILGLQRSCCAPNVVGILRQIRSKNATFHRDLAITLKGTIDRSLIPTRSPPLDGTGTQILK